MGNGAFKIPEKNREKSLVVKSPPNSVLIEKPSYTNKVIDQVAMTAMSYQDYYARHHDKMKEAGLGEEDQVKFVLVGMHEMMLGLHRGGSRVLGALEKHGADWKNHLKDYDKQYLQYAEQNLNALGIPLNATWPEAKDNLKKFGKAGNEVIKTAETMPIYGTVITNSEDLQMGDRVLSKDFQDGKVLGLRGGNPTASAILYMATFMTCQGVSVPKSGLDVQKFKETTSSQGNDAFSTSSDERAVKKQYRDKYSDEKLENKVKSRVDELKEKGMFAIGLAMFTKGRFDDLSSFYVLGEQLQCAVSVCAPESFVQGQVSDDFAIGGVLSITKEQSAADRGGNKPIHVTIYQKSLEMASGSAYTHIYEKTPITAHDGGYIATPTKEELNKLNPGEYRVVATYEGQLDGENLSCSSEVSFTVQKAPEKEEEVEKPKLKLPQITVSANFSVPRRYMQSFTETQSVTTWTWVEDETGGDTGGTGNTGDGGKEKGDKEHGEGWGPGHGHAWGHDEDHPHGPDDHPDHPHGEGHPEHGDHTFQPGHGHHHEGDNEEPGEPGDPEGHWESETDTSTQKTTRKVKTEAYKGEFRTPVGEKDEVLISGVYNVTTEWYTKQSSKGETELGVDKKRTAGLEVGYARDITIANQKFNVEGRLGKMFRKNTPVLAGLKIGYGDPAKLGRIVLEGGNDIGKALHDMMINPRLSVGAAYEKRFGRFSFAGQVSDFQEKNPYASFTVGFTFGSRK
ncbi:MAG: hypothetical protein ABIH76_02175 [Candidatus Bathyarchaeota archaeon]